MATEETIMTAAEYSESVYQWLQQAHQWQALAVGKSRVLGILVYSWQPFLIFKLRSCLHPIVNKLFMLQGFQPIWHISQRYTETRMGETGCKLPQIL